MTFAAVLLMAIIEMPVPSAAGAAEPFLFHTRDGLGMSWLEPNGDRTALRFAVLRNEKWSAPRTIVERKDLFVNWADFPSVVEDGKGVWYAHWLQKSGKSTYAYDVRMSVSNDRGATWSDAFLLNRDGREAEHGFASLAPLPGGGIGVAWLDGRNEEMSLRYATIDARGTIRDDSALDTRTCECCTTGMTMTANGPLIVYRDRSPDEIRDIVSLRRTTTKKWLPRLVHADHWKITGCPVNGPQIDAVGNRAATAWFTAAGDQGKAYVAFTDDGGATFAKPVRIDDGNPAGRTDVVMLDASSALVTWIEQNDIRARVVRRDGTSDPSIKVASSSNARAAGFPRIARVGSVVWFAWTEVTATTKRIHLARMRI